MFENIRLAFQGVWSHKLRSMLTMLGIIIGIAAIITIVSTIKGTNEQIKENLKNVDTFEEYLKALPPEIRCIVEKAETEYIPDTVLQYKTGKY